MSTQNDDLRAKLERDLKTLGLQEADTRRSKETRREIYEVTKEAPCPNCGDTSGECYTTVYQWVSCYGGKSDPNWRKVGVSPDGSSRLVLESLAQLRESFGSENLEESFRHAFKIATGSKEFFKERKQKQKKKSSDATTAATLLNAVKPQPLSKRKTQAPTRTRRLHAKFIEEVKQRADIVETISSYVELKKAGKEFLGCCPFHNETTPSFTVTPQKGVAYCFGCSWGGSAIKFLMELNRVSFIEAVLDLARSANIPIKYEDGSSEYDYPDPLPRPLTPLAPVAKEKEETTPAKDYTVDEWRVNQSVKRLLSGAGDAAKALAWLENRGITREMVAHYRLGLEKRVVLPDQSQPDKKETYSAIAIFIPVPDRPGRFYVKKRVAPWLEKRPEYLAKWAQFGLPATIWFTHNPPDAQETRFCEGEWDAILLAHLARQRGEKVAVCCSTSGAGTVPKPEELERLPGQVTIFFDRDEAGEKGAQKLGAALGDRALIGSVPMPDDCQVKGWDVSDAIQAGYRWEDFKTTPVREPEQQIEVTPPNQQGIRFKVLGKSLDELLENFPELESEAGKDWLKMRKFTPDHVVESKYFDWASSQPGISLAVKSGWGTGKTFHSHKEFLADDNVGANAFGYRNSLLIQFTERGKNWHHLQQDLRASKDDLSLVADPNARIAACFDSLIYFQPHHFEGKRLILDEIEGSFKHLYQSKTAVSFHRHVCKERAGEAIANSEAVLLLDGSLTDLTVAHAERISGKKFVKVENTWKSNRGKVTYYTGTLKFGKDEETGETVITERKINDYSLLHKEMISDPEPFICGADSQEKLEAWHEILRLKGRKVFRLDGSNSNTSEAKKFLADPAKYILENGIEVVLYSPTAESGLSIDLQGYFKRSYFFFFGVVQTNEQTQFLARLRDPDTHIHIFCQNQGIDCGKLEQTATHIQEAFLEYTLACSQISLSDVAEGDKQRLIAEQALRLVQQSNDPHFQYECHLKAKELFERRHLRKCLEYALHTAGYQVEVVAGYQVSKKELEAAQEAVQIRKSAEIFNAQRLTDKEANDKAKKFDATQQEKTEVARHRLVSRLPGIENKTFITTNVVKLPQAAVQEIKSGCVSLETAQKLGIAIPETPSTQLIELEHLPLNFFVNQREGAPVLENEDVRSNGGIPIPEGTDSSQNQIVQNQEMSTAETPSMQVIEVEHLPLSSLNNQGKGVLLQEDENINRNEGVPVPEGADCSQNQIVQNHEVAAAETPSTQAIELEHLPPSSLNNQGEGVLLQEDGEVEIVITETKAVFDPEFIHKVKYQDRAWLPQIELHFLVQNPGIAKLLQQKRWYKNLQVFSDPNEPDCVKRINLSTYKSDWLKIHTLLEMGIGFFLNPDSRWSQDSPEVLEFWEKGKDARRARFIGSSVGDSTPCEYIGRVLDKLDVKRKREQIKNEAGEKIRVYRVDADYLASPVRSAVYECVRERIESHLKADSLVLNWDAIVENVRANEIAQNPELVKAEMLTTQRMEVEHLRQNISTNKGEGVLISEGNEIKPDPVAELMEAFEFCELPHQFAAVIEGYPSEEIEAAIALCDTAPKRRQLESWYQEVLKATECSDKSDEAIPSEEERDSSAEASGSQSGYSWKELPSVGQMLHWVAGGLEKLVLKAIDADGTCQVKSLLSGVFTNTRVDRLKPAGSS